nr:C2H2-type zinc finger protein [Candidatus Sigynarchaeota archaeon]
MLNENTPTPQEPNNNFIGPIHATKLAFKVVPFEDESTSSWIIRTLRANLVNSVSFIREKLNIELGSVDLDFDTPREIVDFFSSCTDLGQDGITKLAPMLPAAIKGENSIFAKTFWKTNKWTQGRDTDGARFCPLCLASDPVPYFRRKWRLALNIICEKHRCLLENKCPSCNTIILPNFVSWNQEITTCYNCGQDITKAEPIIISDDCADFLTFAYGAEKLDINHYKRVNDIAWFIVRYCDTTDPAYKMGDDNKNNKFLKALKEYENSATKLGALQQPIILYNIITMVLHFLNDDTLFEAFLKEHDSNLDIIFSEKPFICKQCGLRAAQRKTLVDHARVHTGEKPFKCEVCGMEFSFRVGLKSHLKTHTSEKPFKCSACDMRFARKDALERHFHYNHSDDRPLKCDQCGKAFKLQVDLEKHQKRHTGKRDVQCPQCKKMFYDTGDMTKHLITHSEIRPHICDVCGDAFKTAPRLKKHKLIHSGEKPFTCEICGASFIQKTGYQAHLLNHEGKRPYKCDMCEMSFTRKEGLRVHKLTHLEEKPFKCPQCEMTFVSKPHLTMHLRMHTDEKPFTCEQCGRAFAKKEYVKKHLLTHTGEKKIQCPHCEKNFSIKSNLDGHIQKIHLTLKPFVCEHCNKAFKTEELHLRHLRTHTGEKPFVCDHCGKGFAVESNYSEHVHIHENPVLWENTVEPKLNESLLSLIMRFIRCNKKNPPSVMRQDLHFEMNNADPEFHEKVSTIIKYFAQHSGIPEIVLESLITRPPEALHFTEEDLGRFSPINNILCKVGNPGHPNVSHGSRFCPTCLANDAEPYFRKEWRLGMVGACLEHSCLLEDRCPSCGKPLIQWNLRWDEPLTNCSHCGFDLRKSEPFHLDSDDRNIIALKALLSGNPRSAVDI